LVGYDHTRYSCLLLGKDVKNISLQDEGLGNSVDISCYPKDPQSELHVAISTSQNQTIGPFIIPSKAYLNLEHSFEALKSRVDDLANSLASSNARINADVKKLVDILALEPQAECIVLKGKEICSGYVDTGPREWDANNRATRVVKHDYATPFAQKPVVIDSIVAYGANSDPRTFAIFKTTKDDQDGFNFSLVEKNDKDTSFTIRYHWLAIGIPKEK
jgi:hypothetical protein